MAFPSIFKPETSEDLFKRIDQLSPMSQRRWGKMNVAQMLAHCSIPYAQALGENKQDPPYLMKIVMRLFFRSMLTNEVPYKKNSPTAPAFIIVDQRDFEKEKAQLKSYITRVERLGINHFDGRPQITLGKLNAAEWSNLLYKHLDHHLQQFGV